MRRHGDSYWHLHRAVVRDDESLDRSTIRHWLQGSKSPRSVASMEVLARSERRIVFRRGILKRNSRFRRAPPPATFSMTSARLNAVGLRGTCLTGMGSARDYQRVN